MLACSACPSAPAATHPKSADSRVNGLALPTGPHETITVSGKMTSGCTKATPAATAACSPAVRRVELWIDADACGDTEYAENAPASVDITWREDNQWGPGNTYTITRFN
ncbi:hypothetical protein ULG90_19265 [Halopseudomonas pachastrellae]|nr:hypothetical protein ULG90_19265 [Halopseudomonas pachastrellae]